MALKGFLTENSYSVVSSVYYDQKGRSIRFSVNTYTDETLITVLNSFKMDIQSVGNYTTVEGYITREEFDANTEDCGKPEYTTWIMDKDLPTGKIIRFEDRQNTGEDGAVHHIRKTQGFTHGQVMEVDGELIRFDHARGWETLDTVLEPVDTVWDEYFGLDAMQAAGSDVVALAYNYLKLRPEYVGTQDV